MNITQEQLRNIIKESIAPLLKVKELKLTLRSSWEGGGIW